MRKLCHMGIIGLFAFCIMNPQYVISESVDDHTFFVSENIKNIGEFLKKQDYFDQVSKLCHEDTCFSVDIHDLSRSIQVIEEKMYEKIKVELGEDEAISAQLKGFSITKILTR